MINLRRILTVIDIDRSFDSQIAESLALAGRYDAELHLLHVTPKNTIPRFGGKKRLDQAREKLNALNVPNTQVKICREIRQGSVISSIGKHVQEREIDLLMVDPVGVGASTKKEFKAIVNRLIDLVSIPVVAAPSREESNLSLVRQATEVLAKMDEDELGGDHDQTLQRLLERLENQLKIKRHDAEYIVAQMEKLSILHWVPAVGEEGETSSGGDASAAAEGDAEGGEVNGGHVEAGDDQGRAAAASSEGDASGDETDVSREGHWQLTTMQRENDRVVFHEDDNDQFETTAAVSLLMRAIESGATDVHIDPTPPSGHVVKFRIDGRMEEFCRMHEHVSAMTMKQMKLMANVSLGDPFTPTESRLLLPKIIPNHEVRITTAPVANGEAIALRLVDYEKSRWPLADLGLSPTAFAAVYKMLHSKSGMILISGPTGAGKTTTAYSILSTLCDEQQNVISLEDPVELVVPFMRQINVDRRHGFTMRSGLSTILRMDPDAVFIGEIRNSEGAQVALQAASCGKRAFSTIHMRDVSATLAAMIDFDIGPKSLAENLCGVMTQRLVRKVCKRCCESGDVTRHEEQMFRSHGLEPPAQVARPRGCEHCRGTGYRGRIGVFEAVVVDEELSSLIRDGIQEPDLRALLRRRGVGLVRDALQKVADQVTSIQEVQEMSWMTETATSTDESSPNDDVYERGAPYQPVES